MQKILSYVLYVFLFFIFSSVSIFSNLDNDNNILLDAFSQRKDRILNLINGGELETQISALRESLDKNEVGLSLNQEVKSKLLNEIDKINETLLNFNKDINNSIIESKEFDSLIDKYNHELKLKNELVEELNNSIKENEINNEKINVLLNKYVGEKNKIEEQNNQGRNIKIYIFTIFTLTLLLVYIFTIYLHKKGKLDSKKTVYINFFLLFGYIIFLIWFFFYLYPELSIFLIFVSGYLLVINAHLVSSFIGSLIVLERFKIGDIIKFSDFRGQVIKITPLYVIILPITDEGIFKNKPIYIPNINILKENVTKDITPNHIIHRFQLTIREDSGVDIMKFVEEVELNILTKFLNNRLSSLDGSNDTYKTSFKNTTFGHTIIEFVWIDEDTLNKKVERKIIGYLGRISFDIKKAKLES